MISTDFLLLRAFVVFSALGAILADPILAIDDSDCSNCTYTLDLFNTITGADGESTWTVASTFTVSPVNSNLYTISGATNCENAGTLTLVCSTSVPSYTGGKHAVGEGCYYSFTLSGLQYCPAPSPVPTRAPVTIPPAFGLRPTVRPTSPVSPGSLAFWKGLFDEEVTWTENSGAMYTIRLFDRIIMRPPTSQSTGQQNSLTIIGYLEEYPSNGKVDGVRNVVAATDGDTSCTPTNGQGGLFFMFTIFIAD